MNIQPLVLLVDDDQAVRESLTLLIETIGFSIQTYDSAEAFLKHYCPRIPACLVLDVNMPGMSGPELQIELIRRKIQLPIIFLTGYGDIPLTVKAMKAGAADFLIKPINGKLLIECIKLVFQEWQSLQKQGTQQECAPCIMMDGLTSREMEVMLLALEGCTNKKIARHLGISYRTVEIHRAHAMKKTGAVSLLEFARICEACRFPPDSRPIINTHSGAAPKSCTRPEDDTGYVPEQGLLRAIVLLSSVCRQFETSTLLNMTVDCFL
jgi:FixJ family two-component response regulator